MNNVKKSEFDMNINSIDINRTYFDFQATTPMRPEVQDIMKPYMYDLFGNPHSNEHSFGWETNKALQVCRNRISKVLKSDPEEIIFTSGATESNNLAIKGLEEHFHKIGKKTIIIGATEHKCVLNAAFSMKRRGFTVQTIPVNKDGKIELSRYQELLETGGVGLVSIMHTNNEIGTIQDISSLSELAHHHGALFHTDAAQAAIFQSLDINNLGVDLMSISGHKIYGPKGIGLLYVSNNIKSLIEPLMDGGGQEYGIRSGTTPTFLCVGLTEALCLAQSNLQYNQRHLKRLSAKFIKVFDEKNVPYEIIGSPSDRHPGNLNIAFSGMPSSHFLLSLQPMIAASSGSACNSGTEEPSYVLSELGIPLSKAETCIRISFGIFQTIENVTTGAEFIANEFFEQTKVLEAA